MVGIAGMADGTGNAGGGGQVRITASGAAIDLVGPALVAGPFKSVLLIARRPDRAAVAHQADLPVGRTSFSAEQGRRSQS